ncbi:DMT family transporter [Galbibacter sp.]|jgi:drug/metabolite transporter (DMT)-like permease|uniref:DMT family transporter n=1 Tax=Galbibacter sp. TaxID=2918471 RepID=UPI003A927993
MDKNKLKWVYLFLLSIIWGSSFILIKKGLVGLTPIQVGSLRILFSAVFLFCIGFKYVFKLNKEQWKWTAVSAFCGVFAPAFLFAYAETEIDSNIAGILNSMVPLFTILIGFIVFKIRFKGNQLAGVIIGLIGAVLLIFQGARLNPDQNYYYSLLIILASFLYATNANVVKSKLQDVSVMAMSVGNFVLMALPAFGILIYSGFFDTYNLQQPKVADSLVFVAILGVVGTGITIMVFNRLIQISTPVFSTSVTYLTPLVGILWGVFDGEYFGVYHFIATGVILFGVYVVNFKRYKKKEIPRPHPLD